MNGFLQSLRTLGPLRLLVLAGIGLASIAFLVYATSRVGSPDMTLLYGDLDLEDSSQIVSKLDAQGVPYEIRGNGTQIFVPRQQVLRLRMTLAEEGLPTGGTVGYEIFDRSNRFGASSFVNHINRLRALEGELARTVRELAPVKAARVHLVIPERQLFLRERQKPSASIVIKTHGGVRLSKPQVSAIQHLIAAAVPGLDAPNVSVIDDRGNLLARGSGDDDAQTTTLDAEEAQREFESRLARKIETLVERSVGVGKVRAQVSAEMDFDRITTSEETFDPDSQVARSTQAVEETTEASDTEQTPPVSVASELPQDVNNPEEANGSQKSVNRTSRTEETVNYEISRTTRNLVRETGVVRRLSVAVLVDGSYKTADDGTKTYVQRSKEEMKQLASLVRSAIGYNEERGDVVEIVNMQFTQPEAAPDAGDEESLLDLSKEDYMRIGEMAVLAILVILVILLVVRPLLKRLFEPLAPEGAGTPMVASQRGDTRQIAGPGDEEEGEEQMIDIQQVEGRVKASTMNKIGDLVEKHPEETVSIIRNWMYQAG